MAALVGNPDAMTNTLNGNPYDNPQVFQSVVVTDTGSGRPGAFTILSLLSPDDPNATSQPYRFGVADEAGKINVNALLALDNGKGDVGYQILMDLPNMTEDVANSILDWLDPSSDTPRSDGAKDDYYSALNPPYHCKNGPIDSIEELLLVKGVTPQLLFGNDRNRNGVLDADEDDGSGQVDLGWSAYLTVYSREPNTDSQGNPRIFLNDSDLNTLDTNLATVLGQPMADYIVAYRLYGAAPAATGATGNPAATTQSSSYTALSGSDTTAVQGQLRTARASSNTQKPQQINSVYDLIGSSVNVPSGTGPGARTIKLPCPLNDPGQVTQLLPLVLDETTTTLNTDLTPRVNVNTASQTVLEALPGIQDSDVQTILSTRPRPVIGPVARPDLPDAGLAANRGQPAGNDDQGARAVHHRPVAGLPLPGAGLLPGQLRPGVARRGGGGRQQRPAAHRLPPPAHGAGDGVRHDSDSGRPVRVFAVLPFPL